MVNTKNIHNKNLKLWKRKKFKRSLLLFIIILISIFVLKKIYIKLNCRNLDYAVEHYLSTGKEDNRVLRVRTMTLIFCDNNKAVVQVFGLKKDTPHNNIGIESHLKKDKFNSWILDTTYPIETGN